MPASAVEEASVLSIPGGRLIEPREIVTLSQVSWEQYVAISDALPERPGLRISYDGQRLEIMTTSQLHERWKRILGRAVEALAWRLDLDLQGGGSSTFRSEELVKGLEPDECYWIAHAAHTKGMRTWTPDRCPPPDLAIEIDVTSRSIDRQSIYAQLGVPEIWRFDGVRLRALVRTSAGEYQEVEHSQCIPGLPIHELIPFLAKSESETEQTVMREFDKWLRRQQWAK